MVDVASLIEYKSLESIFNDEELTKLNSCLKTKVFILGYPCEMGARNMGSRAGCERAPDTFRELLA